MKKLFLLSTLLFLTTMMINAQSALIFGVEGGANFSKLKYTGDFSTSGEKQKRVLGYQGGAVLGVKFGNFSVLSGLNYKQLGGNTEVRRDDPNNPFIFENGVADVGVRNEKVKFSTLSIPILLRYEFGDKIKFGVTAGPVINIGSGDIKLERTYNLTTNGELGPFEEEYSFGDLGNDLVKKSFVSFQFSPGVLYQLNDNSVLRFNAVFEGSGDIRNPNLLVGDANGNAVQANGSVKYGTIRFELGYEYRINFKMGTKY